MLGTVTVELRSMKDEIDGLINMHRYSTISEFVRGAVREKLDAEHEILQRASFTDMIGAYMKVVKSIQDQEVPEL